MSLRIVILGLSITSSWGNGHATCYRGLVRELTRRGHDVLFLERDKPWYAEQRDLPCPPYGKTRLYKSLGELKRRFSDAVANADCVMVGSYVPDGIQVSRWVLQTARGVTVFYDIDTPVTLAKLAQGDHEYISPELIPCFSMYLSFTGGPTLEKLEQEYGSPMARAFYCSVDPTLYFPEAVTKRFDLGLLGTFSEDRQPALERLLIKPAKDWSEGRFVVAGPLYPDYIHWPGNVERIEHLPPTGHRRFYNAQRFTLNITRAEMIRAGYSPSVRLFEAAACGTPIISDYWPGLEEFLEPGYDVIVAQSPSEVLACLRELDERKLQAIGLRARQRVLKQHTAAHRAAELESLIVNAGNKSHEAQRTEA
ncbi:MAG: glycosyltransferase [Verrucomicrobiota bacterium]